MTDRPILFSAPMIQALLAGRKTQTRRILKPQPGPCDHTAWAPGTGEFQPSIDEYGLHCGQCGNGMRMARTGGGVTGIPIRFAKGDRLWVRESFAEIWLDDATILCAYRANCEGNRFTYAGDGSVEIIQVRRWKPGIHLPRTHSRLTLTVTDVRVERLQEISEADAVAEGVIRYDGDEHDDAEFAAIEGGDIYPRAVDAYGALWTSINGPGSWDANPWVVAITFVAGPKTQKEDQE